MISPIELPNIRNITVSGRIGSGTTTLANSLSQALGWTLLEGGELFEKIHKEILHDKTELEVNNRPDKFDLEYEEKIKKLLRDAKNQIIQSHLAGFDAQGIDGVFKILVVCEDLGKNDKQEIRIDRLVNRRGIPIDEAKEEIVKRESRNLDKWRRLYASDDKDWVYWDRGYYDLVVNTYSHNQEETLRMALKGIGYKTQ